MITQLFNYNLPLQYFTLFILIMGYDRSITGYSNLTVILCINISPVFCYVLV